ncbi:amino acid adenylation domain-containing protein [Plectonema cf. radiosum LEGE 06105]|uniref:Amino acid adenylation domain-containing protein n=1 Tax=Plectonema cf. radiosum LEGE 06105 TaxID=945769 RepID=A0A8J7F5A5_9CYAN|nr:non-ribosomal peptide synthetase [Plectonema radiosum]MBE9216801.1 amino acid adenylation domain-containing protein [Plectonema cf. radiosum LEGE 06105]
MPSNSINTINGFQLSPQQKHLWLLQQFEVANQPYRVQCSVLIEGNLNYRLLELVLQKVVEKHEIFRTSLQSLKGMNIPLQVIHEPSKISNLSINIHNLSEFESQKQNLEIENIYQQQRLKTFEWQSDCVLDFHLVILSSSNHLLLIAIPAICADTVSIHNLVNEISRLYAACLHEQELSGETLQYADIAAWQNELFEEEEGEVGKKFWQNQNISHLLINKLPSEKYSETKLIFLPKFINFNLNHNIFSNTKALANHEGVCISTILMACWQILLCRLTGQSEMTVAVCCDGRNYDELKPAIGLLAKYIPVGVELSANSKFSEIIKQLEENINEIQQWQDSFSWEQFVSINDTNGEPSFFPFAFDFNSQTVNYFADDVSFCISKQDACIDKFKVKLTCHERNNSLLAELHYDASLFEKEDIENLAIQLETLLASAINNPATAISQLEILSPNQRQKILVDFNNTQSNYSQKQCIHELIEQQAAKTPNNLAVVFENQQLTYAQLNARANQLAHHLKTLGVGAETVVALCVERSLEMCIGFLGILKAGGAYLALDSLVPEERLSYMIQDAVASVILTQQHLAGIFSQQEVPTVCLDTDWHSIAEQLETNLPCEVTPENLLYVVYTSGSAGKPKGVAVEHRQLFNYLQSILEKLNLGVDSSFATVSTFAADLGNTNIFPALCIGGCLHIISQERATNPEALVEYCDRHTIDCLKIVPSHLMALLSASQPQKILPRKRLVVGGEALSSNLVKMVRQYTENCQIINHYGPSETTVGVSTFSINTDNNWEVSDIVTIGRPLANTQIYILDHYLQPVPIGVSGEIYISGNNLARGYVNHPELTGEKFIPNPFGDKFGSRLYKTGDLGRYLPDGNIEFVGRADHQVKVRGFRIELSEIESVLRQHPNIQENIVLTQEEQSGNKRLLAYFVTIHQSELSTNDLRDFLQQKLPDYMIPSIYIQLKALPLTPNGKIDRQALPAPENVKPELAAKFVAPRNYIEKTIAKIWSGVLKIEQVGIYDNFFELGGDSIISIQIIARLNQAGLQLTPKQLFDSPTVAGLAAVVGSLSKFEVEQAPVTGLVPLTPIQHWFFEQNLSELHHWNQSLLLEVPSGTDLALLEQAVQYLQQYHDALRLRFIRQETGWQQINAGLEEVTKVSILYQDLSALLPAAQKATMQTTASELQASLNLAEGLLMRVALFDLGKQGKRLLLVIHHLAVDGISWRILLADFEQVYQQLSQKQPVYLPLKTTSFKKWSAFLQNYAQSSQLQREKDYWLKKSLNKISLLPYDYPGGSNTLECADSVLVSLSIEETEALLKDVPTAYHTQINDVLLTTLVQSFTSWTGEDSLLIDLEGHERETISNDINLTRTVGWFTTIFPVLLSLEGISQTEEALKAIKEQLQNIPNKGIGYGILRYLNQNPSDRFQLQTFPQAEVRFNYLGKSDQILSESSLFKLSNQSAGNSRSLQSNRRYVLDINGFVLGEKLQLEWTYSNQIHQRSTIEHLANEFIKMLRSFINNSQFTGAIKYTTSNFPNAEFSQKELDELLVKINLI